MTSGGVLLATSPGQEGVETAADLAERTDAARGSLDDALALARDLGASLPAPGTGETEQRWSALATIGAVDLTVARVVEPHLDALAILAEADQADFHPTRNESTWGVYAAEGGADRVVARPAPGSDARSPSSWRLTGTKPWCSLASFVDHALVTAWTDDTARALFVVSMHQPAVAVDPQAWVAHGLSAVRSTSTTLSSASATIVGTPGWYLERDGFAWGGIGVAAVWYGGAVGLARRLRRQAEARELDQIGWAHLGSVDAALHAARSVLLESARDIDGGRARGQHGALLALRVRQVVADAVELTLRATDHALGPGPLALEADHVARVSDLRLYVRQHHAERDLAALGRASYDTTGQRSW